MPSITTLATAAAALTLTTLLQTTPAPPAAALAIGTSVAGGAATAVTENALGGGSRRLRRRQAADPLAGLPTQAVNDCKGQLAGAHVTMTETQGGALFAGVPSACMTLSAVFLGMDGQGAMPVPMGVDSLQYDGLTAEEMQQLRSALAVVGGQ